MKSKYGSNIISVLIETRDELGNCNGRYYANPEGMWLTREQVRKAVLKWVADPEGVVDTLNELFGKQR